MRSPIFFSLFWEKGTRYPANFVPWTDHKGTQYRVHKVFPSSADRAAGKYRDVGTDPHQFLSDMYNNPLLNQRGQIMSPPTFLTFRWPWLKESSLWVLRSDKFEFGFDSITHHRSTARDAGPNRDVGTGPNHVLPCL